MKTILISLYFGKLPKWFDLWLLSCKYNQDYNWLVFTDDKTKYNIPNNVKIVYSDLNSIKTLFEEKLKMKISLDKPYKICDYRPAFGFLFEKYIGDYDYWGYTDIDVIYGNLSEFIKFDKLKEYKKILNRGHLTLYKNDKEVNRWFKLEANGLSYKEVFTSPKSFVFDEWQGIHTILNFHGINQYNEEFIADINPNNKSFLTTNGRNYEKQTFIWENGKVYKFYSDVNNKLQKKEYAYIHFQKRNLTHFINIDINNSFSIAPDGFRIVTKDMDIQSLFKYNYTSLLEEFFFRYNSLKKKFLKKFLY